MATGTAAGPQRPSEPPAVAPAGAPDRAVSEPLVSRTEAAPILPTSCPRRRPARQVLPGESARVPVPTGLSVRPAVAGTGPSDDPRPRTRTHARDRPGGTRVPQCAHDTIRPDLHARCTARHGVRPG